MIPNDIEIFPVRVGEQAGFSFVEPVESLSPSTTAPLSAHAI